MRSRHASRARSAWCRRQNHVLDCDSTVSLSSRFAKRIESSAGAPRHLHAISGKLRARISTSESSMKATFGASVALLVLAACAGEQTARGPTAEAIAKASADLTAYLDAEYEEAAAVQPRGADQPGPQGSATASSTTARKRRRTRSWTGTRQSVADMKAKFDAGDAERGRQALLRDLGAELQARARRARSGGATAMCSRAATRPRASRTS